MSEIDRDSLALLLSAGLLDEEEQQLVEEAIASSDEQMSSALDRAEAVLGRLPLALEPRMPRPEVREALLDRIAADSSTGATRVGGSTIWRPVLVGGGLAAAIGLAFALGSSIDDRERAALSASWETSADAWRERVAEAEARTRASESARRDLAQSLGALQEQLAEVRRQLSDLSRQNETMVERVEAERRRARAAEARANEIAERLAQVSQRLAESTPRASSPAAAKSGEEPSMTRRALELVRAPDSAMIDLVATDEGGRGSASVFWDRGLRYCYLHARDLEPTTGGSRLALWLEYTSGQTVRVTDFEIGEQNGEAEAFASLPIGLGEVIRTFVTRESAPGRSSPVGAVELVERSAPSLDGGDPTPFSRRYRRRF